MLFWIFLSAKILDYLFLLVLSREIEKMTEEIPEENMTIIYLSGLIISPFSFTSF